MPSILQILIPSLIGISILPHLTSAQQPNGPCVQACPPKSSACDGDETGTALDQCTCASFSLTNDFVIDCVKECPEDEQIVYANKLPALCNAVLFPDLDLSASPTLSSSASTGSGAASAGETGNIAAQLVPGAGYLVYAAGVAVLL
ncbi:hypothetical protein B0A52_09503 [Exophiala mesophila]|uniref:Extracellular membrane protein CFEM domain-containing protein n=1 Tax=Exophiala mesophila TaxID=212818 RepID=A0A438MV18_EXOME|nr:hypothetical protein B0A52_09503 [Exophiala mesophila]